MPEPVTGLASILSGFGAGKSEAGASSGNNTITFGQFKGASNITTALFIGAAIITILAFTKK